MQIQYFLTLCEIFVQLNCTFTKLFQLMLGGPLIMPHHVEQADKVANLLKVFHNTYSGIRFYCCTCSRLCQLLVKNIQIYSSIS